MFNEMKPGSKSVKIKKKSNSWVNVDDDDENDDKKPPVALQNQQLRKSLFK